MNEKKDLLKEGIEENRPALESKKPVPSVRDVIGKAVPFIGAYKELNNKEQVVALINDVSST